MNPITAWKPDPVGLALGTDFECFETNVGISGLAREPDDDTLDLLVVVAEQTRCGQFRRFIAHAKRHWRRIRIWHVDNGVLAAALVRYGFQPATITERGEVVAGFEWEAE